MGQQLQFSSWRGGDSERLWLAALVDAMEKVSQPAKRLEPCDSWTLAAFRAQLALPAQVRFGSSFSMRN
jgi:hypothetical protein